MITIEEALSIILAHIKPLRSESFELADCLDRVLAQDISAPENIPPFANSAMDGFAVRAVDTRGASVDHPVPLLILEDLPAGQVARRVVKENQAIRIMTGAPLPEGADSVVKVEDTGEEKFEADGRETVLIYQEAVYGDHIRLAGESVRQGELVLERGTVLRPPEIGMLAALGYPRVSVIRPPRAAIISTGDELQNIEEELLPGKIRDCNRYSLSALVRQYGGTVATLGIVPDEKDYLRKIFSLALTTDLVITSGGVSAGKYDLVREIIPELEGELLIDRVAMKPGKPLIFSMVRGIPVFSLPGNPVSVMVSFLQFVRPALLKMQGKNRIQKPEVEAILVEDCNERTGRTHLIRVVVEIKDGVYQVRLTGPQGSGILRSLVLSNGLMVVPPNRGPLKAGTKVKVILIDQPEVE